VEAITAQHFKFGDFELDAARRLLTRDKQPVALSSKTFDVLLALVENHGRVMAREQLLERVWPDQFVEESNLTVQISALRKIFGEGKSDHRFIVTVPGRGYSFVADGEMIVESHTLSRIVVEEKIEKNGSGSKLLGPAQHGVTASQKLGIGIAVGILFLAGAAGWIYRSRNENIVNSAGSQITSRVFTSTGGIPRLVAISPDGKAIAYVERFKGQNSLRIGELENGTSVQIAPYADRLYYYLAFSPDGKNIYFTERDTNHSESTLMRISVFGGGVQELIPSVHSSITFSPDGKSLAFLRRHLDGNRTSLMIANAENGKDERVLAILEKPENAFGGGVSWSPDGQLIAFAASCVEGTRILAASTSDGSISKIGEPVGNRIVNLAWMPDGKGLIVNRNSSNDAGDGQVWQAPYPQGEMQKITTDTHNYSLFSLSVSSDNRLAVLQARMDPKIWITSDGDTRKSRQILEGTRFRAEGQHGLAVAPDGKVLFSARSGESRTIWEVDVDDSANQRQLTVSQKDSNDDQVSVTADDRFLVFESNRSGQGEIWRANRDGSDLKQLTSGGGNIQPAVSPDSLWVVYIAVRDGKSRLMRVSIDGGEPMQMTNGKASWPAVSPDGKFVAFGTDEESDANPNQVIKVIPFEGGEPIKSFELPVSGIWYNRLRWSPDGKAIIYKDEVQGLWRQNLNSDKTERMEGLDDLRIIHLAVSNKELIYSGGIPMREIVILENFH